MAVKWTGDTGKLRGEKPMSLHSMATVSSAATKYLRRAGHEISFWSGISFISWDPSKDVPPGLSVVRRVPWGTWCSYDHVRLKGERPTEDERTGVLPSIDVMVQCAGCPVCRAPVWEYPAIGADRGRFVCTREPHHHIRFELD